MLMKLRGRDRWRERVLGVTRPSNAASAAERLTWRVLNETEERTDGRDLRGTAAGADAGGERCASSKELRVAVAGGVLGGENA